jgi:hypothetical protein
MTVDLIEWGRSTAVIRTPCGYLIRECHSRIGVAPDEQRKRRKLREAVDL